MSNYFYHPLGDYAANYVDGSATYVTLPHTYETHGFNKVDLGVGGGLKVYSMTNGLIQNIGFFQEIDGVSIYGCVVRTTDCGYSRMQAKLQGGTAEDYPVFFTYIEMDSLNPNLKAGQTIKKGDWIGITNSVYNADASNLHLDIQPWDRYGGGGDSPKAQHWYGAISLDEYDAYGHKGSGYKLDDHLDSHFTRSDSGIKDHTGKLIGVKASDGKYYPPNSAGIPIMINSGANEGNLDASQEIGKWYAHLFMMQTPIKIEGSKNGVNMAAGWYPSEDRYTTGIEGYFSTGIYTYPVYNQCYGPWAGLPFWDNIFADNACNISALATIVSGLTGTVVTPPDVKRVSYEWGGYTDATMDHDKGQNIINNLPTIFTLFGVPAVTGDINSAKAHLKAGKPVELNIQGFYGAGSSGGHLIALLAYDESNDKVFIGDPATRNGSGWYPWSEATGAGTWYILAG